MEPEKTPDSKNSFEQKEQCWKDYHSRSQDTLQSHSKNNINNKNQYDTSTETEMQINGIKLKTQTWINVTSAT